MFCLLYIPNSQTPKVIKITDDKTSLTYLMQERATSQCFDQIGKNNYVDTQLETDLTTVSYPVYPTITLKKISETEIQVFTIEKKVTVEKGYIYNTTKELLDSKQTGTYYIVQTEETNNFSKQPDTKSICCDSVVNNYDKVIVQLVEALKLRKIE
jgi:hypothetical protein